MQSGGEEEQDEEAHTPLPPRMEIIKDPSAQDEKVRSRFDPVKSVTMPLTLLQMNTFTVSLICLISRNSVSSSGL